MNWFKKKTIPVTEDTPVIFKKVKLNLVVNSNKSYTIGLDVPTQWTLGEVAHYVWNGRRIIVTDQNVAVLADNVEHISMEVVDA